MTLKIYHNPRCSKSRKTLALLEENGLEPKIILYLENPPTADDLTIIVDALGGDVRAIIRKGEAAYKELDLSAADKTKDELIKVMVENPILIERPIVVNGAKAAVGRPPETVLDII